MEKHPCELEKHGKLHLCQHSLKFRKTMNRCKCINSKEGNKKLWCDVLHKNIKSKNKNKTDAEMIPKNIKFEFIKATARNVIGASLG